MPDPKYDLPQAATTMTLTCERFSFLSDVAKRKVGALSPKYKRVGRFKDISWGFPLRASRRWASTARCLLMLGIQP